MAVYTGFFANALFYTPNNTTLKAMSSSLSLAYLPRAATGFNWMALWIGLTDPSNNFIQAGGFCDYFPTPLKWVNFSQYWRGQTQYDQKFGAASGSSPTASLTHSDINHNWVATVVGDSTSEIDVADSGFGGSGVWKIQCVLEVAELDSAYHSSFINGIINTSSLVVTKSDGTNIDLSASGLWTYTDSVYDAGSAFDGWCHVQPATGSGGTNMQFSCG